MLVLLLLFGSLFMISIADSGPIIGSKAARQGIVAWGVLVLLALLVTHL